MAQIEECDIPLPGITPSEFIGVIPAGGTASRLRPCKYAKELLPVAYLRNEDDCVVPVPSIGLAASALCTAKIRKCVIAISDSKPELMRYLGDGNDLDLTIAYVQQTKPRGLAHAVDLAFPWTSNAYTCLILPDTIIEPRDALVKISEEILTTQSDLVLGLFPTDVPEQLGPVRCTRAGEVIEVLDKPASTDLRNTWGLAVWSPRLSKFLNRSMSDAGERDIPLGQIFNNAISAGYRVRAIPFSRGRFIDIGTFRGISTMLDNILLQEEITG